MKIFRKLNNGNVLITDQSGVIESALSPDLNVLQYPYATNTFVITSITKAELNGHNLVLNLNEVDGLQSQPPIRTTDLETVILDLQSLYFNSVVVAPTEYHNGYSANIYNALTLKGNPDSPEEGDARIHGVEFQVYEDGAWAYQGNIIDSDGTKYIVAGTVAANPIIYVMDESPTLSLPASSFDKNHHITIVNLGTGLPYVTAPTGYKLNGTLSGIKAIPQYSVVDIYIDAEGSKDYIYNIDETPWRIASADSNASVRAANGQGVTVEGEFTINGYTTINKPGSDAGLTVIGIGPGLDVKQADDDQSTIIQFSEKGTTRKGWMGYGSSGDRHRMTIVNDYTDGDIEVHTGSTGDFKVNTNADRVIVDSTATKTYSPNQSRFVLLSNTENTTSHGWVISSDERLKDNIKIINGGQAETIIDKLIPKEFNYISSPDQTSYGLIAQEVEDENLVSEMDDSDSEKLLGVKYTNIIAPLVKYTQDIKQENVSLQTRVQELEDKYTLLEEKLNQLLNK